MAKSKLNDREFARDGEDEAHPLAETLRVARRFVPPALVPPTAWWPLLTIAGRLPAALTSWAYLECRLGGGDTPVDAIFGIDPPGRDILAGDNPAVRLAAELRAEPAWERVAELSRAWRNPGSALHGAVTGAWLEFDAPAPGQPAAHVPGVFVFSRGELERGGPLSRAPEWATSSVATLLGGAATLPLRAALDRVWRALPEGASAPYVGVMLPRGTGSVRVCVMGVERAAIPPFLDALEWPGSTAALAAALQELHEPRADAANPGPTMLHLDLAPGVGARVGLEYVFDRPAQLHGELPQREWLDHLVKTGVCTPAKRAALAQWPGWSLEELPHELWTSRLHRRVNHVKVLFDGDRVAEAKGYLCLHHAFHRPG